MGIIKQGNEERLVIETLHKLVSCLSDGNAALRGILRHLRELFAFPPDVQRILGHHACNFAEQ